MKIPAQQQKPQPKEQQTLFHRSEQKSFGTAKRVQIKRKAKKKKKERVVENIADPYGFLSLNIYYAISGSIGADCEFNDK